MAAFVRHASQGMEKFQFRRGCGGQPAAGSPVVTRDVSPTVDGYPGGMGVARGAACAKRRQPGPSPATPHRRRWPVFWIGWEGAVMRAGLVQSAAPLNQYWDFCAQYDNKTPAQDGASADNPFRRGILCHESISSGPDRQPHRRHRQRYRPAALAEGDVRVAIDWSSLNYKDARRSPAKAKLSVSFRWCRALILPVR